MNASVTFPAPAPELKLPRQSPDKWAAAMAEERRRLQEDQEALRERESNLRDYESRLRSWQTQLDAGRFGSVPAAQGMRASLPGLSFTPSPAPAQDEGLQVAWEKLHRAREILEAEQNHLRDDRIAIRDMEAAVKQREEALAAREARLAEREALISAAMPPPAATAEAGEGESAMSRLTRAPFDIARSVFGSKK
jgi:DNA repair exonuclease SbcCD ATPase subunit